MITEKKIHVEILAKMTVVIAVIGAAAVDFSLRLKTPLRLPLHSVSFSH